jgi:hypothetical protein
MNRPSRKLRAVQAAALMAFAAGVNAETSPYTIGAYQAFSYDSNVFRSPDAIAQSSGWSSTGLVAGIDQPFGRQRFYANGNIAANVYQALSELDNTSYSLSTGLDWATIEHLKGKVYLSLEQKLGNYGGENDTLIRAKNIQNSTSAYATAQYGLVSLLALNGRLAYNSVRYSAPQYARYELTQESASLGIKKQFSGQLTLGTGATYTEGAYTTGQDFGRYDLYMTGEWIATGLSTINGRLNYSKWHYTVVDPYDTSSITGWLQWVYVPTGKLSFNALVSYDTLANSGLTDVAGEVPGNLGGTSQLTTALQLGANYAASAKVQLKASLNYYTRTNNSVVIPRPGEAVGNLEIRDRVTALNLGAQWTPTRNWRVACNLSSDTRNQYSPQAITLSPYDAWGASCSAQFALH